MTKKAVISQRDFDTLLRWLDQNRETAAEKYEKIRRKLIRIFGGHGCFDPETLADETFDRVSTKLSAIIENYHGEPALYFYGVAKNVYREWLRRQEKARQMEIDENMAAVEPAKDDDRFVCLERCLQKMPVEQRRLILDYYQEQKRSKIERRKEMARSLGISAGTLQIRMFRIRQNLRECVSDCTAGRS
jgi:RNA polymerase sigma factor (sigma-70 family)